MASENEFATVPIMRKADKNLGTQLEQLKKIIEKKYGTKFASFPEFQKWSVDHLAEFWAEMWDFLGIIYSKRFDKVIDLTVPMSNSPEWFSGARVNFAENLLKFRDDKIALIAAGEDKEAKRISYAEMFQQTSLYAAAFRKFGLKKGDVVACYMPLREEVIFAMLAVTSIGAIWTGENPYMGAFAVRNRFKQVEPKVLFTIDRLTRNGESLGILNKVNDIVKGTPSLQKVIIVPFNKDSLDKSVSEIEKSCYLGEFLKLGRDKNGRVPDIVFEQVSFSHPLFIIFTSGTTGIPKAVIRGFGSLMCPVTGLHVHLDCNRDAVWFFGNPVAWSIIVVQLIKGVGILLYEGFPYYRTPTYFWDLVQEHKVSHLFLAPIHLDTFEKRGFLPPTAKHVDHLKVIVSGGSVVKPSAYEFVFNKIKKDIIFCSLYGASETSGPCIFYAPTLPIYSGELSYPNLGVSIECIDEKGNPVEAVKGDVVFTKPCPSHVVGLWGDHDGSLFRKSYFDKYPDKLSLGDVGLINPVTKGYVLYGRRDEVLNRENTDMATFEIYTIVDRFPEVNDSLCVTLSAKEDVNRKMVLFIKIEKGYSFSDNLVQKVRAAITAQKGPKYVPDTILEAAGIPYNMNFKKMEIIVKKIINRMPFNADTVSNPEALRGYFNIPELNVHYDELPDCC